MPLSGEESRDLESLREVLLGEDATSPGGSRFITSANSALRGGSDVSAIEIAASRRATLEAAGNLAGKSAVTEVTEFSD